MKKLRMSLWDAVQRIRFRKPRCKPRPAAIRSAPVPCPADGIFNSKTSWTSVLDGDCIHVDLHIFADDLKDLLLKLGEQRMEA